MSCGGRGGSSSWVRCCGAPSFAAAPSGLVSSADQCNTADTAWQYCLGSAPDTRPALRSPPSRRDTPFSGRMPRRRARTHAPNAVSFQPSPVRALRARTHCRRRRALTRHHCSHGPERARTVQSASRGNIAGCIGNIALVARRTVRPARAARRSPNACRAESELDFAVDRGACPRRAQAERVP